MATDTPSNVPEPLRQWPGHTGNWGRWNNDRGTINLLGPLTVLRAMGTVRRGETVSCTRAVSSKDMLRPTPAAGTRMIPSLYKPTDTYNALGDEFFFRTHGVVNTHIDAFSHAGYHNYAFNGARYTDVINATDGARRLDVTGHGPIITRGVFVDVARRRGVPHLEPGEWVLPEEIADVVEQVEPGDAFVIRTGVTLKPGLPPDATSGHHGTIAGVHWDCLEMLAKKDIAIFATDCGADPYPGPKNKPAPSPIHTLCLVMYGIPIVHNMDLEQVAMLCEQEKRNTFMFVVAPLKIPHATGSAAAPIAVF